ncbi:protein of unknown function [Tepidibacter aestuarii]|nr:protein of unknown function [Tepidibacter aestuarii]
MWIVCIKLWIVWGIICVYYAYTTMLISHKLNHRCLCIMWINNVDY